MDTEAAALLLHFDGAAIYREQEFLIWSVSSWTCKSSHIHDRQMLCLMVPADTASEIGKAELHAAVAKMFAWSQNAMLEGKWCKTQNFELASSA